MRGFVLSTAIWLGLVAAVAAQTTVLDPESVEFFERNIRPVLIEHCYECHSTAGRREKGLALDHRAALLEGGESGPAIRPGNARASRLLRALRSSNPDLRMPFGGGELEPAVIADVEAWIEMGAPDPRDQPPTAEELTATTSWPAVRERRSDWWSFQPVQDPEPPAALDPDWNRHPVDRFVYSAMQQAQLDPSPLADPQALIRRLSFLLTGLPPAPGEVDAFVDAASEDRQSAVEAAIDRYLDSAAYGERWARHWMDWLRYADSHGSEGDPRVPNAWRYRDYIIRAVNADVPYDQLVREHLAGDLLIEPRVNPELGFNESALGIAQYRFVIHGFGPTDALDELVRFTENQIDVVSKAFQGLTVSCARCHNHKFDPISQSDFYALFGVMASSRPAMISVDLPERLERHKAELSAIKPAIRNELADLWLVSVEEVADRLLEPSDEVEAEIGNATAEAHPLHPLLRLRNTTAERFSEVWAELAGYWRQSRDTLTQRPSADYAKRWQLGGSDAGEWYGYGNGLGPLPNPAGDFHVLPEGDLAVDDVLPAGIYSHALSSKHAAVLGSPRFRAIEGELYLRFSGDGKASARYVVQNYPQVGEVFPITSLEKESDRAESWRSWDLSYWDGDHIHIELATAADQPLHAKTTVDRSWFGVTEAVVVAEGQKPPRDEMAEFLTPLFAGGPAPEDLAALGSLYADALRSSIESWRINTVSDAQARFLGFFVRKGLLSAAVDQSSKLRSLVADYRRLESDVPVPTRAPGVLEGDAFDQPMFVRGNHKNPAEPVARRFLEVIDDTPFDTADSGRLALAESILHPRNPLTARVAVNRIWHHLFGRGLVPTTDNFGRMGQQPTHPELLDYLARRFVTEGWSFKKMIRLLASSRILQLDTVPSATVQERDPTNAYLSHARLRRLEAEAIRDSLLAVSGTLDLTRSGPPVDGSSDRRSIYVHVYRNSLDPFLKTFDAPDPVSTKGRRDETNVPAHALALMNDPIVMARARQFANRIEAATRNGSERVELMFRLALGRRPSPEESSRALEYIQAITGPGSATDDAEKAREKVAGLGESIDEIVDGARNTLAKAYRDNPATRPAFLAEDFEPADIPEEWIAERLRVRWDEVVRLRANRAQFERLSTPADGWDRLAHALFNMKEFIYVR
ncbi:MAG: PSD1 and planctomycete cytochrome C domain-containing protein [Acidobacteriota bacterium]|nr:PSD1 and planctomycete cytochrome C domain-containing protein [Acidobacteriota bacterium]